MEKHKNKNFANTASRISAIACSVMDLHVRIALLEVDREKRRLISGGKFLAIGSTLLLLVLICIHIIFYLFLKNNSSSLLIKDISQYLVFKSRYEFKGSEPSQLSKSSCKVVLLKNLSKKLICCLSK